MPYVTLENGKKIKISEESYEELLAKAIKEENEILVPDNITFERDYGDGDELGIVFNNEKQVLIYSVASEVWQVWISSPGDFVKCKLVPVDKKDLRVGYTYFRTNGEHPDFSELSCYCKYLGDGSYAYVEYGNSIIVSNFGYKKWYQVVPINEKLGD